MTIGIYCILHKSSGRCYVGKSINIERRRWQHEYHLTKPHRDSKSTNRYLYAAVQKYGWDAFEFLVLEEFDAGINELMMSERELFFMDKLGACVSGFNLRRDSSSKMIVAEATRRLLSKNQTGEKNANYGNKWNTAQRNRMSEIATNRHRNTDAYGDEWRKRLSVASHEVWSDLDKRAAMAKAVSNAKKKYRFMQFDRSGNVLRIWDDIAEIVSANPEYKWQNIYSVCNGHKPSYMGFIWKKVLRDAN